MQGGAWVTAHKWGQESGDGEGNVPLTAGGGPGRDSLGFPNGVLCPGNRSPWSVPTTQATSDHIWPFLSPNRLMPQEACGPAQL